MTAREKLASLGFPVREDMASSMRCDTCFKYVLHYVAIFFLEV